MELGPILRSLLRRKSIPILIATQTAVVIAILLNLYVGVSNQLQTVNQESGIDDKNMFYIDIHIAELNPSPEQISSIVETDLTYMRNLQDVVDAVQTISVPYSGSAWNLSIDVDPNDEIRPSISGFRMIDDHGLRSLGIELIAGRNFLPEEVTWRLPFGGTSPNQVLLSEQLAEHLFPEVPLTEVVGKQVHMGGSMIVIGVVTTSHGPHGTPNRVHRMTYVPQKQAFASSTYLIRTESGKRDSTLRTLERELPEIYRNRLIRNVVTIEEAKKRLYRGQIASIWVFATTSFALLFVVVCGMTGMVNFAIRQRTAQIGIRRALGATRLGIVWNLLVEYAIVVTIGILVGIPLAIGLNVFLVSAFSYEKLGFVPSAFIVVSTLLICMFAVVFPAKKISELDPALVTRAL